eukprot:scaffold276627_cov18-Tisochrysis_lutea.AAC.1
MGIWSFAPHALNLLRPDPITIFQKPLPDLVCRNNQQKKPHGAQVENKIHRQHTHRYCQSQPQTAGPPLSLHSLSLSSAAAAAQGWRQVQVACGKGLVPGAWQRAAASPAAVPAA